MGLDLVWCPASKKSRLVPRASDIPCAQLQGSRGADLCEMWATPCWVPWHQNKATCCSDPQVLAPLEEVCSLLPPEQIQKPTHSRPVPVACIQFGYRLGSCHPQRSCREDSGSWLQAGLTGREWVGKCHSPVGNLLPGIGHGIPSGLSKTISPGLLLGPGHCEAASFSTDRPLAVLGSSLV